MKISESYQQQNPIKNRTKIKKVPVEVPEYNKKQYSEEDFADMDYRPDEIWADQEQEPPIVRMERKPTHQNQFKEPVQKVEAVTTNKKVAKEVTSVWLVGQATKAAHDPMSFRVRRR